MIPHVVMGRGSPRLLGEGRQSVPAAFSHALLAGISVTVGGCGISRSHGLTLNPTTSACKLGHQIAVVERRMVVVVMITKLMMLLRRR